MSLTLILYSPSFQWLEPSYMSAFGCTKSLGYKKKDLLSRQILNQGILKQGFHVHISSNKVFVLIKYVPNSIFINEKV